MKTLNKLEVALKNGFANTYSGETRDWMDQIDDDAIYRSLIDPDFEAFVREIVSDGLAKRYRPAA